jgi:hypothetical protein
MEDRIFNLDTPFKQIMDKNAKETTIKKTGDKNELY